MALYCKKITATLLLLQKVSKKYEVNLILNWLFSKKIYQNYWFFASGHVWFSVQVCGTMRGIMGIMIAEMS
jgi:hypothetical protein